MGLEPMALSNLWLESHTPDNNITIYFRLIFLLFFCYLATPRPTLDRC